ncbi:hypothetical protein EGR_05739 [Echinococcus granulosus]|uniref:Uncharacterized protein n=1 Tax=Echinococcus granulosus TaxID=6210 RepID=W6UDH6_ECHGR|nr:hypothetical protein EGR_05739 [Echinococcus granulosus]EUB59385.1 hypothetical protein EGR_05739 [Echinococcus granulosus]
MVAFLLVLSPAGGIYTLYAYEALSALVTRRKYRKCQLLSRGPEVEDCVNDKERPCIPRRFAFACFISFYYYSPVFPQKSIKENGQFLLDISHYSHSNTDANHKEVQNLAEERIHKNLSSCFIVVFEIVDSYFLNPSAINFVQDFLQLSLQLMTLGEYEITNPVLSQVEKLKKQYFWQLIQQKQRAKSEAPQTNYLEEFFVYKSWVCKGSALSHKSWRNEIIYFPPTDDAWSSSSELNQRFLRNETNNNFIVSIASVREQVKNNWVYDECLKRYVFWLLPPNKHSHISVILKIKHFPFQCMHEDTNKFMRSKF